MAYVVFLDESGFLLIPTVRRTWAPCGKTPLVFHRYQRDKSRRQIDQAEHDVRAEANPNADCCRQIAPGTAVCLRRYGRWLSQH